MKQPYRDMNTCIIIGCSLGLFLRSTDEGKPLYSLLVKWSYICPKWLYKPTVECSECRSLWLSILSMMLTSSYFGNWNYLLMIPMVTFITFITHKVYNL